MGGIGVCIVRRGSAAGLVAARGCSLAIAVGRGRVGCRDRRCGRRRGVVDGIASHRFGGRRRDDGDCRLCRHRGGGAGLSASDTATSGRGELLLGRLRRLLLLSGHLSRRLLRTEHRQLGQLRARISLKYAPAVVVAAVAAAAVAQGPSDWPAALLSPESVQLRAASQRSRSSASAVLPAAAGPAAEGRAALDPVRARTEGPGQAEPSPARRSAAGARRGYPALRHQAVVRGQAARWAEEPSAAWSRAEWPADGSRVCQSGWMTHT